MFIVLSHKPCFYFLELSSYYDYKLYLAIRSRPRTVPPWARSLRLSRPTSTRGSTSWESNGVAHPLARDLWLRPPRFVLFSEWLKNLLIFTCKSLEQYWRILSIALQTNFKKMKLLIFSFAYGPLGISKLNNLNFEATTLVSNFWN